MPSDGDLPAVDPLDTVVDGISKWLGMTKGGFDLWRMARLQATWDSANYFAENMSQTAKFYQSKNALHRAAFGLISVDGLALEFGVAKGTTINYAAACMPDRTIYGFDSWKGLPETWRPDYQAGHFAQALPNVAPNVKLVQGWFDKSIPPFLEDHPGDIAYMHVDCDLYSSTKTIFDLLANRIVAGTVIVFDEYFSYPNWRQHEHKAFHEFLAQSGRRHRYVGVTQRSQQVAVVIE